MKLYILALHLLGEDIKQSNEQLIKLAQLHPKIISNNFTTKETQYDLLLGESIFSYFSFDKITAIHIKSHNEIEIKTESDSYELILTQFSSDFKMYFENLKITMLTQLSDNTAALYKTIAEYLLSQAPDQIRTEIYTFLNTCPKYRVSKEETFSKYLPTEILTEKMLGLNIDQLGKQQYFNFGQIMSDLIQLDTSAYNYVLKELSQSQFWTAVVNQVGQYIIKFLCSLTTQNQWIVIDNGFAIIESQLLTQTQIHKIEQDDDKLEIKLAINNKELGEIKFTISISDLFLNQIVISIKETKFKPSYYGSLTYLETN